MRREQHSNALTILLAVAEASPEEWSFQARMRETYALLGDRPKAIAAYEKAQALSPNGTEAKEMLRQVR